MYLEQCTIRNIKCFEDITLDFRQPDGTIRLWSVIIGENGTGKTTLLQALAIALMGEKAASVLLPRPRGWVRADAQRGQIEATILQGNMDMVVAWSQERLGKPIEVSYEILETSDSSSGESGPTISERTGPDRERLSYSRTQQGHAWFAAGYGPFRRLSGGSEQAREISKYYTREARFITLFREDAALTDCAEWLMQLDYAQRDETNPKQQRDAAVLNVVRNTLNQYLLPNDVRLTTINSQGVFFHTPFADKVLITDLSDGYRAMLALAIDLLRHLSHAYDGLFELPTGLSHVHGVVLIDELDVHLHPTWQRRIGTWLKEHFPGLQFIVATHSPFIPQVADDHGLYVLRRTQPQPTAVHVSQGERSVRGWRADQILSILFDTPSMYEPETEQRLREYARLKVLADTDQLPPEQQQHFMELQAWVDIYLAPPGDSRAEMEQSRQLQRRVLELSRLLREEAASDSR